MIFSTILDVIYPEDVPWQRPDEWQQVLRQLPRTEQLALSGNITEDTILNGGRLDSDNMADSRLRRWVERHLVRAAAFLWYEHDNITQKLIVRGKFTQSADPEIFVRLAREAAYEMLTTDFLEEIDLIIPVPLHPKRLRERGFNQAEIIANAISQVTNIPMNTTLLQRIRYNEHQANLKAEARRVNSEKLFELNHPEQLYHKHILLVDDVITTGNTIRACFDALRAGRSCRISVFALGKAR